MPLLSRRASSSGDGDQALHNASRKSSFMSLRREKERPSRSPGPSSISNRFQSPYPGLSLRPSPYSSASPSPIDQEGSSSDSPPQNTYTFPTHLDDQFLDSSIAPKIYLRNRSRTSADGSRSPTSPTHRVSIPDFRLSGSTQHTETPPHTPTDYYGSPGSSRDDFSVVVAPISGVETMDALVDGMNGADPYTSSRSKKFNIHGHHPLYPPPLPKPPPGVVLSSGVIRRSQRNVKSAPVSHSSSEDEDAVSSSTVRPRRRRRKRPSTGPPETPPVYERKVPPRTTPAPESIPCTVSASVDDARAFAPSISEIIRIHAPEEAQKPRPFPVKRSTSYSQSFARTAVLEESEPEPEPEPLLPEEEAEFVSRSSIDSVAEEIQRSLQSVAKLQPSVRRQNNFNRLSMLSTSTSGSGNSPRSDGGSLSISSTPGHSLFPADETDIIASLKPSQTQEVARYLRSSRLTTLLKLTRAPHASHDRPLTVSLSDMGSPSGFPVVVFLGLGCVRHLMGLYDEMADCLNLRLIAIDRWGLGRTDQRQKSAKGIMQWAAVVEEVLDLLKIQKCSVMAHSAGAPYALSFANRFPDRIQGTLCLLAPWIGGGENGSYKWLKYVPNGILKTAQAAEWKVQEWMLGKPPTLAYQGIGYTIKEPTKTPPKPLSSPRSTGSSKLGAVYPHLAESKRRPSMGSNFSEYDDLQDFDGRFDSRSTLGRSVTRGDRTASEPRLPTKRKGSIGFLDRLRGSQSPQTPPDQKQPPRKLKNLRSMGSLKGKATSSKSPVEPQSPALPPPIKIETGLGLDDIGWSLNNASDNWTPGEGSIDENLPYTSTRSGGERLRSFSLTTHRKPARSLPSSPNPSTYQASLVPSTTSDGAYQAALGNALIAASHSEASKGTHSDLLQILNHDNQPWGFSYSDYPHRVCVWYGDKDERIAEDSVRWMERSMGSSRCTVNVVLGADHGLMYKSTVVVDVLECIADFWKTR